MEVAVIEQALNAALNGEYGEGDYCWTEEAAEAAQAAVEKLPYTDVVVNLPVDREEEEDEE